MQSSELIRCRQCGDKKERSLFGEDYYHDVTCMKCGARSGKYGDENEAINLWNGKGIKFYAVMWQGGYSGILLEIWDDEETAINRASEFNQMIQDGLSIHGYKLNNARNGIRETCSVEPIEPNIFYKIKEIE